MLGLYKIQSQIFRIHYHLRIQAIHHYYYEGVLHLYVAN